MSQPDKTSSAEERAFEPPARLRGIQKSAIRQVFDRALPGSINLGLGEPDLPTPDVVRREGARVARAEQNGYTQHAGLPALRDRVAADYPHLALSPDNVVITAGSQEAMYLALMTLIDEGDEVLLPDPGFIAYGVITRMAGGRARYYKLPAARDFGFDPEEFRRALTPRTKVVVAISPSNPTGRVLSRGDLAEMAAALRGTGAFLVSDEIYRELYYFRSLRAHGGGRRPVEVDVDDGLAAGVAVRPRGRRAERARPARVRHDLRLGRLAEGRARRLERRGRPRAGHHQTDF
jgi:aspartate aminotransferase